VKNADLGKMIAERRFWQGYRELGELMAKEEFEKAEGEICGTCDSLGESLGRARDK
jgi:hypothetical protein